MVIVLEKLFIVQFQRCPVGFQLQFRKAYQQLKVVDKPTEVKGVIHIEKKYYKLLIDKSKIALRMDGDTITIGSFLFNQFFNSSG
jgi:hypothetical protein